MFQPVSIALGLRYLRAKQNTRFISLISIISIVGIILGSTALITILSVMNGFQKEVRDQMLSMTAHATILKQDAPLVNWEHLVGESHNVPEILGAAPYIESQVMLVNGAQVSGGQLRAVEPDIEASVSDLGDKMLSGSLDDLVPGAFNIAIGSALANRMRLTVGDKITIFTPETTVSPIGVLPRNKRFNIVAIFRVGLYEYDSGVVVTHLKDAATLLRMDNAVTGVRLKLEDMMRARPVAGELAGRLGEQFWVVDWTQQNSSYFKAVAAEKQMMSIILTLIIMVAAFNIVSTLVMVVNEKRSDIAILRTIGASPSQIMQIFFVQGTVIGLLGAIGGVLCGVLLAVNVTEVVAFIEEIIGRKLLDPKIYNISYIPSVVKGMDVLQTGLMGFCLALLATLYPAYSASRTNPAEALRYE